MYLSQNVLQLKESSLIFSVLHNHKNMKYLFYQQQYVCQTAILSISDHRPDRLYRTTPGYARPVKLSKDRLSCLHSDNHLPSCIHQPNLPCSVNITRTCIIKCLIRPNMENSPQPTSVTPLWKKEILSLLDDLHCIYILQNYIIVL